MGTRASMPSPAPPPPLRGRRVLVAEDEALIAMMLEDVLRGAGAEVVVAATLREALRLVGAAAAGHGGGLDAAVLDIGLGAESALPVADALARLGVPFLFATGYGEDHDRGRHGAAPLLRKPYDPRDLTAALEALLPRAPPRPVEPGPAPSGGTSPGGEKPDRGGVTHPAMASSR